MSIMTIGDCVIDYYPELDKRFVGGSGLNTAVYLKDKGVNSNLIGVIGEDVQGKKILDYLKHKDFDLTNIRVRSGKTGRIIIKKSNGDYNIVEVKEGIKKSYKMSEEDIKTVKDYEIVHTNIYSHTTHLLSILKRENNLVSFDYSFKVDYKKLKELEKYIDILFITKNNMLKEEFSKLKQFDINYIVLTSGQEGFVVLHNGQEYYKEPAGDYIKDSTGAGDILIAEILWGLHENKKAAEIVDRAAQKAYEACLGIGPFHSF